MHIALVTTSFPRDRDDPSGHFVASDAQALAEEGHRVTILAPGGRFTRDPRLFGLEIVELPGGGAFGPPGAPVILRRAPWRLASAARFVCASRLWLGAHAPDRIEAHWILPCAWPIGAPSPNGKRTPLRVVAHGSDVRLVVALPRLLREHIVTAVAREAESWRFVSQTLLDQLLGALDPRAAAGVLAKATVAPSILEVANVANEASRLRTEHGAFGVVVGRLIRDKRVDAALAHAHRLAPHEPLYVIGEGPERDALAKLAGRIGVEGRFLGARPRSETLAWIAAARCLYFASKREGHSTVRREAEALGTPVIDVP